MDALQNYSIDQLIDLLTGAPIQTSSFYVDQFNPDRSFVTGITVQSETVIQPLFASQTFDRIRQGSFDSLIADRQ